MINSIVYTENETQTTDRMPPKRRASASDMEGVKITRVGSDTQEETCDDSDPNYKISNDAFYPVFQNEAIDFEGEETSPSRRTDTISLLMKIDQLQAELKYERRCRILAERELRQLREMNDLMSQMRHTARDLRTVLDSARQGTASQSSEEDNFPYLESEPMVKAEEPDRENLLHLPGGLRIQRNMYEGIAGISDFRKYISALLMVLFDRDTLATHTLQGRRSNIIKEDSQKPPLAPDIIQNLTEHVRIKFGLDYSAIRTAIRTKLNNEDKLFKKRVGIRDR